MKKLKQIGISLIVMMWLSAGSGFAQPYAGGSGDGFAQAEIQLFSASNQLAMEKLICKIYPNPVQKQGVIYIELNEEFKGTLEVYSITGKKVSVVYIKDRREYMMNLNELKISEGIYTLHFRNQKRNWVRKMIVH